MAKNETKTNTSSSTSAPTNPQVTATTNNILGKLDTAINAGSPVFDKSLYTGQGATTQQAQQNALDVANPVAAGERFGQDDPGFAALRQRAGEDTLKGVNSTFTNSGRFGSGSHVGAATEGLGNVFSELDYNNYQRDLARQQQAIGTIGAVGAAQDADTSAQRQGENDLFQRQEGALFNTLGRGSSILSGTASGSGNTTTNTQTQTQPSTPWWQSAIGLGAAFV